VVVYGATGFTGRLVCAELARRKASFAIAGRDPEKLGALAASAGGPEVIRAPLDDAAALVKMAGRARVVLDCAGPFARLGKPVQDAALAAGAHFLDITGEAVFLGASWARSNEAKERGVAIVNAVGFDVVPTDCAAVIAAEGAGAPVESVRIAFMAMGARATQGTTRSAFEAAHMGGAAFVGGRIQRERVAQYRWRVPFPEPAGTREAISIPWGDIVTAPRSTGAKNVRTFVAVPKRLLRVAPVVARLRVLLKLPGAKALGERWIRRQPEGPTPEERARAVTAVHAEATGAKGVASVWALTVDGYDFTARSAVHCALLAADPAFDKRGTLTPSQAFGAKALLDALAKSWGSTPA
jgi:saccharopine dehydrogenase (NAD+, L-lysine-forming)